MFRVFLGLGSNIGDRLEYLTRAVHELGLISTICSVSSVYETEPVGMSGAGLFLNIALELRTSLSPDELLACVKATEGKLGRKSDTHMKPREIDIDILMYDERIIRNEVLQVPHPELHRRRFVLEPLNEIAGDVLHPILKRTVEELLRLCPDGARAFRTPLRVAELHYR